MKIILLIILLSLSLSKPSKISSEFLNFISTNSKVRASEDAIQAVLQLLTDIKGANEQAAIKSKKQFEEYGQKVMADLSAFSGIQNQNLETVNVNQDDLDTIIDKIQQTKDFLEWNEKRRSQNQYKLDVLASQRCEANGLFIDTLSQYKEALDVLQWIQVDLENKEQHNPAFIEEDNQNDYTEKLNQYTNLFKETALNDFIKLGEEKEKISFTEVNKDENNEQLANGVVSAAVQKVQNLIQNMKAAIDNLQEQEISSSNDFIDFRNNIINEQVSLNQEYESRVKFLNSLINDKDLAEQVVVEAKEILHNTQQILKQTQDSYDKQKDLYETENKKRSEENQMIEEIILIYKSKIAEAKSFIQEHTGGDSYKTNRYDNEQNRN